jgi:polyisoprenoid-binding protein YceI
MTTHRALFSASFLSRFGLPGAALSLALLASACDNDPGKGKPAAQVTEPAKATAAAASGTPSVGARYAFSADGSKVGFVGAKVTGKHEGSFGAFTGTITLPGTDVAKGTVTVEIDTASVTTDAEKLTGHLKSSDFFDVERFPKARFTSTAVKTGGDGGASHTLTGNLELHGVTKSITFPATIRASEAGVEVDAEFSIQRKDFGIEYAGKADDLISDAVLIKLAIRAKKPG